MKAWWREYLSGRAPLTWSWLALLFVTTRIQRSASHRDRQRLLRDQSTNLKQLHRNPLRVLFASLLWLDGRSWWPYLPVFAGLLDPAERRLGSAKFVAVGLGAHVVATLTSQKLVARSISAGKEAPSQARARDVGVSYFVFGIGGWLTGQVPAPWRRRIQLATGGVVAVTAASPAGFTAVGHCIAFAVGVCSPRRTPVHVAGVPDSDTTPSPVTE